MIYHFPLKRIAIIGVGLIGGSFAKAVKKAGLVEHVVGCSRSELTLEKALELGVIDSGEKDAAKAVENCDLVMLAVPIGLTEKMLAAIKPSLSAHTIVTDAGSVKGSVIEAAKAVFGEVPPTFIPGHPIAGAEKSGVEAAKVDLFKKHKVILTPLPNADIHAVEIVSRLWKSCGAEVLKMDVEYHDHVLARTSHLPHLLAFSLVDTLAREHENLDIFRYAAGGFRDFTRIAASDPTMWHDIFTANREAVLDALDQFSEGVKMLREAVASGDSKTMLGVFTRAKSAREHFTKILTGTAYLTSMKHRNVIFSLQPGGALTGSIRVAGDKSISHRSIMLGSLAEGVTEVSGFLEGEDALATLQAFRDMGVVIEGPNNGKVKIFGVGLNGLQAPPNDLYVGNSGTSMRLLSGILSAQKFDTVMTGDESLSKRPMERVAKPLRSMGAKIETTGEKGTPPVRITGNQALKGIHYDMPVASAQVKSGILLAGLWAEGETSVTEPAPTRDHTERMLRGFGYNVKVEGNKASIIGGSKLKATKIDVPADISSSAFFMVAASIAPGSDITLSHVGINPTRIGVINILRQMGADLTLQNEREIGGEPVADIRVKYAPLKGISIPEDQVPLAIDEFPSIFIAAACAEGTTILTGAEELRVKESDRIQVMADGLHILGIDAQVTPDGVVIKGGQLGSGEIESHGDHRIAMSFSIAALRASGPITIQNCANVATSFPNFVELAKHAGLNISVREE